MIYLYMELNTSSIIMTTKKVIAFAHSKIRAARGGDNPPMIVTIPKDVAEKSGMRLGDNIQILTDGEKIVIRKTEVPEI